MYEHRVCLIFQPRRRARLRVHLRSAGVGKSVEGLWCRRASLSDGCSNCSMFQPSETPTEICPIFFAQFFREEIWDFFSPELQRGWNRLEQLEQPLCSEKESCADLVPTCANPVPCANLLGTACAMRAQYPTCADLVPPSPPPVRRGPSECPPDKPSTIGLACRTSSSVTRCAPPWCRTASG